jgi:hypothetical protein
MGKMLWTVGTEDRGFKSRRCKAFRTSYIAMLFFVTSFALLLCVLEKNKCRKVFSAVKNSLAKILRYLRWACSSRGDVRRPRPSFWLTTKTDDGDAANGNWQNRSPINFSFFFAENRVFGRRGAWAFCQYVFFFFFFSGVLLSQNG